MCNISGIENFVCSEVEVKIIFPYRDLINQYHLLIKSLPSLWKKEGGGRKRKKEEKRKEMKQQENKTKPWSTLPTEGAFCLTSTTQKCLSLLWLWDRHPIPHSGSAKPPPSNFIFSLKFKYLDIPLDAVLSLTHLQHPVSHQILWVTCFNSLFSGPFSLSPLPRHRQHCLWSSPVKRHPLPVSGLRISNLPITILATFRNPSSELGFLPSKERDSKTPSWPPDAHLFPNKPTGWMGNSSSGNKRNLLLVNSSRPLVYTSEPHSTKKMEA